MDRILVTGAKGQLGWTIGQISEFYTDFDFVLKDTKALDITQPEKVDYVLDNGHYTYCINCAAYTDVEGAEKDPKKAFAINAEGVRNLAEACKRNQTILIHVSTDYVFDGEKEEGYTVDDKTNPINEYGKSKLKGEQYIQEIWGDHYIVRTSWLYCRVYGKNFYRTIAEKAGNGEQLKVVDNQFGRPTDTFELAEHILSDIIFNKKPFGLYHFSDGDVMSWYEFAEMILKENGLKRDESLQRVKEYRTLAKRPIFVNLK
ncbi:dTDP-4-dehydrorhamnose reductase [Sediminicola luteus]|uniref:dTDP-4-dehydrorhamnose reductase n=1 Tax=Sediminicola luteus TaxID=319238 RepID=A0A2A4GFQ1_9FLAO|nr:dTDP-4-dehydrorhamnose reductase [Sediminicola luteus]PCE66562.1 dTDP-4-dehydrorhamnose reductase [Sediminicola luteus]